MLPRVTAIFIAAHALLILPTGARSGETRWPDWRNARLPRIELPPDPSRISVSPVGGWAWVLGGPGAAGDARARMVRVLNLATGDQAAAPVRADGSFGVRLFAPRGSSLQINSNALRIDELPWQVQRAFEARGKVALEGLGRESPGAEAIAGHVSSSPGIILRVAETPASGRRWPGMVRKIGPARWLVASAEPSVDRLVPGDAVDLEITLAVILEPGGDAPWIPRAPLAMWPHLHCLFDADGRHRPYGRLPLSAVRTPTGLPVETHGEMVVEFPFGGRKVWNLGGTGLPVPCRIKRPAAWRKEGNRRILRQQVTIEIPAQTPPGIYGLGAAFPELGNQEFGALEPANSPALLCRLTLGDPAPPRLGCLLLGSAGTGGSRGTIAREDRSHFAVNMKTACAPEKLVVPRDDAFSSRPWVYPLDPYLPMVSTAVRPFGAAIPPPLIPFDFQKSRLTVTVQTPSGGTHTLGPAPLSSGQNDMSVLRPDYLVPDRIIPPVRPTYGNPGMADIYHLTGRGAFDFAFEEYGHHVIRLEGHIHDVAGSRYGISGTYDVYVAKPLDVEVFPEPGTPLEPGVDVLPQIRVMPPRPAEVEIRFRHLPGSDATRAVERTITGRANRWGVFVPGPEEPAVRFDQPGEYICDVTVRHEDATGTLWMACRRGASVVMSPDSGVVVHGERGNRSPHARWRARWFAAGDGRFVTSPPAERMPRELPPDAPLEERLNRVDLGHTCLPYESGDVAWLGHTMAFSLFPGLTFEDPEGTIARLVERRWPSVREGAGREGLYPYDLKPEDRRAIGEMPYVCMTASGIPPSIDPRQIDQWGYFYVTSWRPGVSVRTLVAEDAQPVGYWFFDDPYAWQFGNGPQGDLPGDVKMSYGGGVFRDKSTGLAHYGGYASMLVLIDGRDPLGARVLPPFDGLLPGSPPCGSLLKIGGKRYDVFLTFGAVGPGAVLEVGDRFSLAGVVWPPVSGHVEGEIISPSGERSALQVPAGPMGVFHLAGPIVDEPGLWRVTAEGVCSGKTSAGTISDLVAEEDWPRGGGLGLPGPGFCIPVVPKSSAAIAFDVPADARAEPPSPLILRGHLPPGTKAAEVNVVVSLPGQVVAQCVLPVENGAFQYVYDPQRLRESFPNIDTKVEVPQGGFEEAPAWFDTVTFTFWAGRGAETAAGMVLLQGERIYAETRTGRPMPRGLPGNTSWQAEHGRTPEEPAHGRPPSGAMPSVEPSLSDDRAGEGGIRSSLLALSPEGRRLFAVHPWSGEVVRLDVSEESPRALAAVRVGGEPRSVALGPEGRCLYVALAEKRQVLSLDTRSLELLQRFPIAGEPRAVLPSTDGRGLFVADFERDRVLRLGAINGAIEATSEPINRPACLALNADRGRLYTASFRTGEVAVLDERCHVLRRHAAPTQLNQCRSITIGPGGRLYAPQTRSDTLVGGRMFDRSVFPAVAATDSRVSRVHIEYFPDLLVVPPHRPAEVAVDRRTVYLVSAGSDDVLAIDRRTGWAKWHAQHVGQEPGAIVLDTSCNRLYVATVTGQEIVALDSTSGRVVGCTRFAHDLTPPRIARGRYLFGTATDKRLSKDRWMSCAVCHPNGEEDGRQWDLGEGRLDTRSLRGCLQAGPLHFDAHLDEIQDTYEFTRTVMAGQWFVSAERMHPLLGEPNAGLNPDIDALAAYVASLAPRRPPVPLPGTAALRDQGKAIYFSEEVGCADCHPPPRYTDSGKRQPDGRYLLHDVGTRLDSEPETLRRLDTPSLLGLHRSDPYLHDGRAKTLEEVFNKFNPGDRHGRTSHLSREEIRALCEFLRYLRPPAEHETQLPVGATLE